MGNKNVRLTFSALDEVTSDEQSGYLMRDFKPNLISALEKMEDQILDNANMDGNLLVSNATSFLLLFLYLLVLGFVVSSLQNAKHDIKKLKISRQEVSSSNLNFLNLSKGSPKVPELQNIKAKHDAKHHDPENSGAIMSSF